MAITSSLESAPVLAVRNVRKSYPAVQALDDITLELRAGEIHAICGENGAGKSTLIKIISGAESQDTGELLIDGEAVELSSPLGAIERGISTIYQELNLTPELSVAENIFAGSLPRRAGIFVDWRKLERRADDALARVGASFEASVHVGDLSIAQRQLVEICKALVRSSRVVVMDEPTSSLSPLETAALLEIVSRMRQEGLAVLYVSHRLEEVFQIADRITVLRDGAQVATVQVRESSPAQTVRQMVGREIQIGAAPPAAPPPAEPALSVRELGSRDVFSDISFDVMPGEIVGIYGLIGAGRTEMARAVFGLDPRERGEVRVGGRVVPPDAPWAAMAAGLAYASEDRKAVGLILGLPVEENICLAAMRRVGRRGLWDRHRARALAQDFIGRLDIRPPDATISTRLLSGGNQQKVVLAKWLATEPRVIVLDEPTRGIDVGAKNEIYGIIHRLAEDGCAVVVISSELAELLHVPHRILVMRDGRIVGEIARERATQEALMTLATGVRSNPTRPAAATPIRTTASVDLPAEEPPQSRPPATSTMGQELRSPHER